MSLHTMNLSTLLWQLALPVPILGLCYVFNVNVLILFLLSTLAIVRSFSLIYTYVNKLRRKGYRYYDGKGIPPQLSQTSKDLLSSTQQPIKNPLATMSSEQLTTVGNILGKDVPMLSESRHDTDSITYAREPHHLSAQGLPLSASVRSRRGSAGDFAYYHWSTKSQDSVSSLRPRPVTGAASGPSADTRNGWDALQARSLGLDARSLLGAEPADTTALGRILQADMESAQSQLSGGGAADRASVLAASTFVQADLKPYATAPVQSPPGTVSLPLTALAGEDSSALEALAKGSVFQGLKGSPAALDVLVAGVKAAVAYHFVNVYMKQLTQLSATANAEAMLREIGILKPTPQPAQGALGAPTLGFGSGFGSTTFGGGLFSNLPATTAPPTPEITLEPAFLERRSRLPCTREEMRLIAGGLTSLLNLMGNPTWRDFPLRRVALPGTKKQEATLDSLLHSPSAGYVCAQRTALDAFLWSGPGFSNAAAEACATIGFDVRAYALHRLERMCGVGYTQDGVCAGKPDPSLSEFKGDKVVLMDTLFGAPSTGDANSSTSSALASLPPGSIPSDSQILLHYLATMTDEGVAKAGVNTVRVQNGPPSTLDRLFTSLWLKKGPFVDITSRANAGLSLQHFKQTVDPPLKPGHPSLRFNIHVAKETPLTEVYIKVDGIPYEAEAGVLGGGYGGNVPLAFGLLYLLLLQEAEGELNVAKGGVYVRMTEFFTGCISPESAKNCRLFRLEQ